MEQQTQGNYLATRLIGLMVRQAQLDREADDSEIRRTANAWLESQDEGLASFAMGCQHLALLSSQISVEQRAEVLTARSRSAAAGIGTGCGVVAQVSQGSCRPVLRIAAFLSRGE